MTTNNASIANFVIPCHWDKAVINQIVTNNPLNTNTKIVEVYGALAKGPIGHGRMPSTVPGVSRQDAELFRKHAGSLGLKFAYLFNAPFKFGVNKNLKDVEEYINWVVSIFKADSLVIASPALMSFVRKLYPDISLCISTIAGVLNASQLEKFLIFNPSRVVLHHDANRNFTELQDLICKARSWGVEVEIMVTESCLRGCPQREAHYLYLGRGKADEVFHSACGKKRMIYPREFLKANVIRPEDVQIYEQMGINLFKITGRSKPANWMPEVVNAYLRRAYDGNLIRLVGIDPSLKAEDWIFIDNNSLEGFLVNFPQTGQTVDENEYCDKWIAKLYHDGMFVVKDGSKYTTNKAGELYCYSEGENVSKQI